MLDLHNLLQLVSLGGIGLLCRVLELDGHSEDGCDTTNHAIVILGYLIDQGIHIQTLCIGIWVGPYFLTIVSLSVSAGETVLTEKVCQTLVQVLTTFSSSSAEICESVLELLHNHAEDGSYYLSYPEIPQTQLKM